MNDTDNTGAYQPGGADAAAVDETTRPQFIGRYRVEGGLGKGGFGIVYLANDDQLRRLVAIKVPHAHLVSKTTDAEAYLTEARTVANLDYPHIVPVFDVGSTDLFPCFVVSKYIDGTDLATRLKQARLSLYGAAELVATVAEALHYAHKQGVVHRDIKPRNILLDRTGKPFVGDFGLALREQDKGKGPRFAGTPAYMSPEQARGEGHRVDGRSDIFSLGIVLYELLTGQRPFKAVSEEELLEQIANVEARPPRQIDDAIPKELDRICLKALSKRASERYSAARDMTEDLRHFLASASVEEKSTLTGRVKNEADAAMPILTPTLTTASESQPIKIVPKGLRSFDATDANFFLELLPGPRDRDGLPDSIRFWKARIESTDADSTFSLGLIYGPSGCGKSSIVKAGLLPRLAKSVTVVYIEATGEETEARLLKGLRRQLPDLPSNLSLIELLAALRRGRHLKTGQKVLMVLDQFEQWLHVRRNDANAELVRALRHCDGVRVQCTVMVRDDFWLAVSRFMQALEIRVIEGENSRLVDLFDHRHARKILASFGKALGALPESRINKEQDAFLDRVVAGLSQEDKVISVRLALFAEMMKGKAWTPATLKKVGGTEGVGITFLEETFTSSTAPPQHRFHQKAAQMVLKALLPEAGTDIKGQMRSRQELLEASGYAARPKDFDAVLLILDSELRLITPTDSEGKDTQGEPDDVGTRSSDGRYYQLTHDYLVPSLRDWLTRKQKETRRGRAELLLADRTVMWNARPEKRQLPSFWQWLIIRCLTAKKKWTPPQRRMIHSADRHFFARGIGLMAAFFLIALGVGEYNGAMEARGLRDRLITADAARVPAILEEVEAHSHRVKPLLLEAFASETDPPKKLRIGLGLVKWDKEKVPFLYDQLLQAKPQDFVMIRQALEPYKDDLIGSLCAEMDDGKRSRDRRFRAACTLIKYAENHPRWREFANHVVDGLVMESPLVLIYWKSALEPVRLQLLPALAASLETRSTSEHRAIVDFYRDFAVDDALALKPLQERLAAEMSGLSEVEIARRKASIVAALTALGNGDAAWPLLVHTSVPTLRSFLIERLGTSGVDPKFLKQRLEVEKDTSARRALILALGNFTPDQIPELVAYLSNLYEADSDPGIHAACRWALQKWNCGDSLAAIDKKLATGKVEVSRNWYVNNERQTFSIIVGPPQLAPGKNKQSHRYAISATEVTVEQFRSFFKEHKIDEAIATTSDLPVHHVSWYDAAAYCNWLSARNNIDKKEWCYRENKNGQLDFVANYLDLQGYRLPTLSEWEFACRANSQTLWHFGQANDELSSCYAWWLGNAHRDGIKRSFPVALLKPNDFGLFDMHGNVAEWCQETKSDSAFPDDKMAEARGGGYLSSYQNIAYDSAYRNAGKTNPDYVGIRLARTVR